MSAKSQRPTSGPCKSGYSILYAWAMDAPSLTLPADVSFDVGQATNIKYLVVQVHYKNVTKFQPPENAEDRSGLTLITTHVPSEKKAGVYLMSTGGGIPAHSIEYFEVACEMEEDVEMIPFAFRTHAHSLGRVISGYRVRDGEWTEIGRKDPRLPEMFYNSTTADVTIKPGDILAARCTMENTKDHGVAIGATQDDEMCNFYIMYYVKHGPTLKDRNCVSPGPPVWFWKDYPDQEKFNLAALPASASLIPGTEAPLVANASRVTEAEIQEVDDGLPGRLTDALADQIINQAIENLDPEDLIYLMQELDQEVAAGGDEEEELGEQAGDFGWAPYRLQQELNERERQQAMMMRPQQLGRWGPRPYPL